MFWTKTKNEDNFCIFFSPLKVKKEKEKLNLKTFTFLPLFAKV